jgi:hypothetical protein
MDLSLLPLTRRPEVGKNKYILLFKTRYNSNALFRAVPWFWHLTAGLSPWKTGFAPGSVHVRFVVNILRALRVPLSISLHRGLSYSYVIWGRTTGPLVAAIQRHSLTASKWATTTLCSRQEARPTRHASSGSMKPDGMLSTFHTSQPLENYTTCALRLTSTNFL